MPYITRDDGEHFVIPSYRDVLSAKNKSALKKDIIDLSHNYGEFITMQRKGPQQYEVAFSPDTGYSLGESVWHHFDRPEDMIYCEVIANTAEAILVIVKDGSVYLDGSFPTESIPEELVIFLTQQNNFDIYIYGDAPISEQPEDGKFSFDAASINSFNRLDEPVFNKLALLKTYNFQPVEPVLQSHGIGSVPVGRIIAAIVGLVVVGYGLSVMLAEKPKPVQVMEKNPYEGYQKTLQSPKPEDIILGTMKQIEEFNNIVGWKVREVETTDGKVKATVVSTGSGIEDLLIWSNENDAILSITSKGITLTKRLDVKKRAKLKIVYPLKEVIARAVDNIRGVFPTLEAKLRKPKSNRKYVSVDLDFEIKNGSPIVYKSIASAVKNLPIVVKIIKIDMRTVDNMKGKITLTVLGN